jgi:hypothetical protein
MKKKHLKKARQRAAPRQDTKQPLRRNMLWGLALGGLVLAGGIGFLLSSPQPAASSEPPTRLTSPHAGWVPLVSRREGFRIDLPAKAENAYGGMGLGNNGLDAMWVATHSTGRFSVRVTRCPPEACQKVPDSVLKGFLEGAVGELQGTLLEEKRLEVPCPTGTCPGLEFEATSSVGYRVLSRLFISGDRMFQILFLRTGDSSEPYRKAVESFSFL